MSDDASGQLRLYRNIPGKARGREYLSVPLAPLVHQHPAPIILPQVGPGCQLPVDAAAQDVVRWATGGPSALAANHHGGRAPPQAAGDAAPPAGRRSGPKGQAEASAGGLAGAPPSRPRRSGGPYRRPTARRRCAAAAPWLGADGSHKGSGGRIIQNLCFVRRNGLCTAGPQCPGQHPSARAGNSPAGLVNCGVAGLCTRHRPDGAPPQLYKTQILYRAPAPARASALTFGGGAPLAGAAAGPPDQHPALPSPWGEGREGVGS